MNFWYRRRSIFALPVLILVAIFGVSAVPPARADAVSGLNDFSAGRFSEAYQAWREAADRSDAVSALYLGVLYDTGFGVSKDSRQALAWYQRAAEGGNAAAMFNTGVMFDAGRGTAADPVQAAEWYRRAADKGYGRAAYNLGLMYESGAGVRRDRAQAIRLYRLALREGIEAARMHLAQLGEKQAGPAGRASVDVASARFDEAQRLLLTRGPDEAARAVKLFRDAAERGNPLASYNLAYCYEHGLGVAPDPAQALFWYRRSAAAAGNTPVRDIAEAGVRTLATVGR